MMAGGRLLLWLACSWPAVNSKSWSTQMTIRVGAMQEDCFYLPSITPTHDIELEFQVTAASTSTGNLDINARVFSPHPQSRLLYEAKYETEGSFEARAEEEGDYRVCFNNYMSTWTEKTIWFEITVTDSDEDYEYTDLELVEELRERNEDTASLFDLTVEEIKGALSKVRGHLGTMRHHQYLFGASMIKDSHQVGSNLERINLWSSIHVVLILFVALLQVYTIRQLFEDKTTSTSKRDWS